MNHEQANARSKTESRGLNFATEQFVGSKNPTKLFLIISKFPAILRELKKLKISNYFKFLE